MYRWLLGMVLCLQWHLANAQECRYTIKISVVETHNFSPVYPAVIYIEALNRSFETGPDGNIVVDSVCAGNYIVRFHAMGYHEKVDSFVVNGNEKVRMKVVLEDHMLKQVEVRGEQLPTVQQAKERMNAGQLSANSGKTLGDLLQAVNGVSTLSNGATIVKPVIHGLHSNRIVMVNNGIRQEDQQWGGEHAPNIDPFLANNITVIKGAAGVKYGTDAIGGVVLVEPAHLRKEPGWEGEVNLAGFSNNRMGVASAMAEHNFRKIPALSFRLQGTYKQGGNYRIPGYWAANTGVAETNYSTTVGYRKLHWGTELFYSHFNTDIGIYRGSHTGNQADLINAINSDTPLVHANFTYDLQRPRQDVVHDLVKARTYIDSRWGMWNFVYGYQHNFRQEYDVLRTASARAQLNLTLNTQTFNINLDHKPVKGIAGQVGMDGSYQDNFFRDGDRLFIPTYTSLATAGYLIERYKKDKWMFEGGLRYDYRWYGVYNPEGSNQQIVYYEFDYQNLSGTLGLKQQLKPNWDWSLTLANAWRAPQASELFSAGLHHGAARVELGNKYLLPEKSYSLGLETNYVLRDKLKTTISLYSQYIADYIYLEPGPALLTIRGYFKTFNYKQTNAWLNGSDISLHYQWNNYLESSIKGSFLRARDYKKNDWLILMPADRLMFNSKYTRTLSKTLRECYIGVDLKYVFEQTRIPANFDSIDYPRPPKEYFLLDASIGTCLQITEKQPLYISISATNILNSKYRDYLDVFRYFINQPGINVVLRIRMPLEFK
jgi:iron complex outermembrane receptor protein